MHYIGMATQNFYAILGSSIIILLCLIWLILSLVDRLKKARAIQAENLLNTMLHEIEIGVLLLGEKGEIIFTNEAALKLLEITAIFPPANLTNIKGKIPLNSAWQVIDTEGNIIPQEKRPIQQAIATGKAVKNVTIGMKIYRENSTPSTPVKELLSVDKNNNFNSYKWLLINVYPKYQEKGKIKQLVCTLNDITDRKKDEAELLAAKEQLQAVLNAVPGYVSWMDADLRYLGVNENLASSFKLSPDDFKGKEIGFLTHINEHFIDLVQAFFHAPIVSVSQEIDVQTSTIFNANQAKNSEDKDLNTENNNNLRRCLIVAQKYLQGQAAVFVGIDISPRVQMELALRQSEERFRAIVEATPMPVIISKITDNIADAKVLYANTQASLIFQKTATEILSCKIIDFYDNKNECEALFTLFKNQGFVNKYELEVQISAEQKIWVQVDMRSLTFNGQNAVLSAFYDITLTKQALESLKRSEARFQKLVANVPGMIYQSRLAENGIISLPFISSNSREIYELNPAEIQANPQILTNIIYPEDRHSFQTARNISAQTLQPYKWEGRIILNSGKIKWIQAASRPEKQANGDILWDGLIMDITERKLSEEALRKSQNTLAEAQKVAHVGSWEYNVIEETITWSDETYRIFGLEPNLSTPKYEELVELIYPEDREMWQNAIEECIQTGKPYKFDYRIINNIDGSIKYLFAKGEPVFNPENQVIKLFGTVLDITERKRAQQALEKAKEELEIRVEERTSELKQAIEQLQGEIAVRKRTEDALRNSQIRYRNLAQQKELLNSLASQIRQSLDLNTILETAVQEIRSLLQIDRCHFIWCLSPLLDQPRLNISHEAQSRDLPSLLEEINNQAIDLLIDKIIQLEIIRIDDIKRDRKLKPEIVQILKNFHINACLLLPLITRSGQMGAILCSHSSQRPWSDTELELLQEVIDQLAIAIDQAELYAQTRAAAAAAQAQAQHLASTLYELRSTQAQLIQSEKMSSLGQMVAGVAHEINNPVTFIAGNIEHASNYFQDLLNLVILYQKYYPSPVTEIAAEIDKIDLEFLIEDLPKVLSSMHIGAERISQIVLSLRNFSRLDEANQKPVDIHEGIENTLLILQHRLKGEPSISRLSRPHPGIQIIKEYGKLPQVECYAGQLNQVFMNIISNAIDALEEAIEQGLFVNNYQTLAQDLTSHSHEKSRITNQLTTKGDRIPTIRISTQVTENKYITIRIADNGLGMTEEVKNQLFDPFFTTKPVGKGTGLGLAISYQIVVEKHKGQIQCFSEPDRGAEFTINIPIV